MKRTALIASDLHFGRIENTRDTLLMVRDFLHHAEEADDIIINGDLFEWNIDDATLHRSMQFMFDWLAERKDKRLYIVAGNHDANRDPDDPQNNPNIYRLMKLSQRLASGQRSQQFFFHKHGLRYGDALIVHGDITLRGNNATRRVQNTPEFESSLLLHARGTDSPEVIISTFDFALRNRAGNAKPTFTVMDENGTEIIIDETALSDIEHVYYGHTHLHHPPETYNGINYTNTGSAVSPNTVPEPPRYGPDAPYPVTRQRFKKDVRDGYHNINISDSGACYVMNEDGKLSAPISAAQYKTPMLDRLRDRPYRESPSR